MVSRSDHPASLPVFVISRPLNEAASREVGVYAISIDRWREGVNSAIAHLGGSILTTAADGHGLAMLASAPGSVSSLTLRSSLIAMGANDVRIFEIGSHAAISEIPGEQGGAR